MIINHNHSAMAARRNLTRAANNWEKAAEKVSSGLRINRAGDDAAGFAISEKLKTQSKGLNQAIRNAMDGISFIQVTDGNMDQMMGILQRMRELAVQAANGIYVPEDRKLIQVEFSALVGELDRIKETAQFNKNKMLNGEFSAKGKKPIFFHVGPNENKGESQIMKAYINTMSAQAFGLRNGKIAKALTSVSAANQMIGQLDKAINLVSQQRAGLGAVYNGLEKTVDGLETSFLNMTGAVSRITDADMAAQMIELTKNQVLLQSSTAIVAQANFLPQIVLQLLG